MTRFLYNIVWLVFFLPTLVNAQDYKGIHPAIFKISHTVLADKGQCYLEEVNQLHGSQFTAETLFKSLLSIPKDHSDRDRLAYQDLLLTTEHLMHDPKPCQKKEEYKLDTNLVEFWNETSKTCDLRDRYSQELAVTLLSRLERTPESALRKSDIERATLTERLRWLAYADCSVAQKKPKVTKPESTTQNSVLADWRELPQAIFDPVDIHEMPLVDILIPDQFVIFTKLGSIGQINSRTEFAELLSIPQSAILAILPTLEAAVISTSDIDRILQNPIIIGASQDRLGFLTSSTQPAQNAGQDLVDQFSIGLDNTYTPLDEIGTTRVYVVDGGIRAEHNDLNSKVKYWRAIGTHHGGLLANACASHGTTVASLIAGHRYGIAKNVELIDVDITPCDQGNPKKFPASNILIALDWIARSEAQFADQTPSLINMSFGIPAADNDAFFKKGSGFRPDIHGLDMFEAKINQFLDRHPNTTILTSAGNQAVNACAIFPARMPSVITVGGTDHKDGLWEHSNYGPCVDTFAPAVDLAAADSSDVKNSLRKSGTSFATATATGVVAQRLNAGQEIETILQDILRPMTQERQSAMQVASTQLPPNMERGLVALQGLAKLNSPFRPDCMVASYDGKLNFRTRPNLQSAKIGILRNDETFEIISHQSDKWIYVQLEDGARGWIASYDKRATLVSDLNGGTCR